MKENTKKVFKYLQNTNNSNITAADLAEQLGLETKTVNGIFTMAIQRKDLGYRDEKEIELDDGSHVKVKFLKLNDTGLAIDPDAED